jgi:CheY-like chemotaxis protein
LRALCGSDAEAQAPHPGLTLGPAAVQEIIRQCGGFARLDQTGDGEVELRICFPAADKDASRLAPQGANHLPRGTETILLAEDDDSVRVVVAEVLRDLGYKVLEARDGRAALELAGRHTGPIDALVADMVMPGFGAVELRRRLSVTRPALRSLFVSGTAGDPAAFQGLGALGDLLLSKPFSPWALASRLRYALDAPRSAAGPG